MKDIELKDICKSWASVLVKQNIHESRAFVIGLFNLNGDLIYANSGMKIILDADNPSHLPADYLRNPDFNKLVQTLCSQDSVFEGFLTTGNGFDISHTILSKAYLKENHLLITGEYDVMELDFMNREMTQLNQEINNIQRKLIKEKSILKQTLAQLKETQTMLIQSEKMNALGQLVAGIAHEINNPIAFIKSNLHSLKESCEDMADAYSEIETLVSQNNDKEIKKLFENIYKEYDLEFIFEDFKDLHLSLSDGISRVQKIVGELRTFSRLDQGALKEIDIDESLHSVLTIAEPEIKKNNIEVELQLENLPKVFCYASELNQVFMNLVINAAQAMENGGKLSISGREKNNSIYLEFTDTGCGIKHENISKIFNPFFTTKPVGSGTGLGLSIAYKIITEKHKGVISVDSKEGQGSVFKIIIPRELNENGQS
ncbi:Two component system response regulator/histidine kinase [Desulfonema limicola]|uniref:histidine kinase n=1 Tax=Desulfonema limicola TaxID=45656 RepID=A0A975B7D1_9BACT|nr:ATP-binding protein [Desulfonema limicola]QTA80176.1 Two component system response regulator/histidine kinase [Desulfonema limicola]